MNVGSAPNEMRLVEASRHITTACAREAFHIATVHVRHAKVVDTSGLGKNSAVSTASKNTPGPYTHAFGIANDSNRKEFDSLQAMHLLSCFQLRKYESRHF